MPAMERIAHLGGTQADGIIFSPSHELAFGRIGPFGRTCRTMGGSGRLWPAVPPWQAVAPQMIPQWAKAFGITAAVSFICALAYEVFAQGPLVDLLLFALIFFTVGWFWAGVINLICLLRLRLRTLVIFASVIAIFSAFTRTWDAHRFALRTSPEALQRAICEGQRASGYGGPSC
jgi:hypothetical protein